MTTFYMIKVACDRIENRNVIARRLAAHEWLRTDADVAAWLTADHVDYESPSAIAHATLARILLT